jgi:hypothetical protein
MTRTEDWADYLDPAEPSPELPAGQSDPLDRVTAALTTGALWSDPPDGLRSALLAAAAREAAARDTPPDATAHPADTTPQPADAVAAPIALRRPVRRRWYVTAAGVAAAAVLATVLAWPRPETTTFAMAGTALAPRASAVAGLEQKKAGLAITLEIKGLAPAPPGTYYAAWLRGPGIVPVGSFHWRKGGVPINLWSGVGTDRYRELFVTLQREGQPPVPSSQVVLSGRAPG